MRFSIKQFFSRWNLDNIKFVRRVIVSVVGATVMLLGIALLVLPGPAFVVIPVGLAILAAEYAWVPVAQKSSSNGERRRLRSPNHGLSRSRLIEQQS
jgi:putative transmembrane protein PGPGW